MSVTEQRLDPTATDQRLRQLDLLFHYSRLSQWLIMLAAVVVSVLVWEHAAHSMVLGWLAVITGGPSCQRPSVS